MVIGPPPDALKPVIGPPPGALKPVIGPPPGALKPVIGPPPDALKPDFQCVRTPWNRGFMTLQLAWRTRTMMLMVPV
jgi:hypothetical protein